MQICYFLENNCLHFVENYDMVFVSLAIVGHFAILKMYFYKKKSYDTYNYDDEYDVLAVREIGFFSKPFSRIRMWRRFFYTLIFVMNWSHAKNASSQVPQTLVHINDVVALHDTSVARLICQYSSLCYALGIQWSTIDFVGIRSMIDDVETWNVLRNYLLEHTNVLQGKTIMVNCASRSKHKNSGNAKWSTCLLAKIKDRGCTVVWVDDAVFAQIRDLIDDIKVVHWCTIAKHTIDDISQWSQFRSLEYRPTVQCLHTVSGEDNLHVSAFSVWELPSPASFATTWEQQAIPNLPAPTPWLHMSSVLFQSVWQIKKFFTDWSVRTPNFVVWCVTQVQTTYIVASCENNWHVRQVIVAHEQDLVLLLPYIKWCWSISHEDVQTIASMSTCSQTYVDWYFVTLWHVVDTTNFTKIDVDLHSPKIWPWQLLVVDRDKFGNTKCLSTYADGIVWLLSRLDAQLWDSLHFETSMYWSDDGFCVQSLSDMTSKKCCRNGSSRWPNWEICIELNRSFDTTFTKRERVQTLPIGTLIDVSTS